MSGDDAASEVDEGSVILRLFGPTYQDAAEAIEPGMCALDDPAPSFGTAMAFGLDFLASAAQVKGEAARLGQGAWRSIVVALVEAQVLGRPLGRLRPGDGQPIQRRAHQEMVVDVGTRDDDADGYAAPVSE